MKISAVYANRTDLSKFDKYQYTLEERVEGSRWFKSVCRFFKSGPRPLRWLAGFVLWTPAIVPILIGALLSSLFQEAIDWALGITTNHGRAYNMTQGAICCALVYAAACLYEPLLLLAVPLLVYGFIAARFYALMDEADRKLDLISRRA